MMFRQTTRQALLALTLLSLPLLSSAASNLREMGFEPLTDMPAPTAEQIAALERYDGAQTASMMGMAEMEDSQLSDVTGQALFVSERIVGTGTVATGTTGLSFYRVGLDATLDLNMNVGTLELGRTGAGATEVDLLADNVAFGCTANASNVCVPSGSGTQLKPVRLTRPYFEFAIANDGTASREVVGIRLGGENISGPLSFGMMHVFSGYLTATARLTMEGMTDVAASCGTDALNGSPTYSAPYSGGCPGSYGGGLAGTGANFFSGTHNTTNTDVITVNATQAQYTVTHLLSGAYNGTRGSLGLDNAEICSLSLCAQMAEVTVDFSTRSSPILNVAANGMRLTQANVLNPGLGTLVDQVTDTLTINQCLAGALVCTGADWIPALIRGPAADAFKAQICTGLSISPCNNTTLNTTPLPFNLSNFHQVEVNSSNLGLSFQRQALRYPGYAAAATMGAGWTFYLPDAFFLGVSEPAGVFTNNIASGAAGQGDLVGLDPVFDNCWGTATFC